MPTSVVMPALELAQETGKLVAWRKKEGDRVSRGEPLLDVETDKAVVEIEAPGDGVLAGVTARPGDVVPVGKTIAWLLIPGEVVPVDITGGAAPMTAPVRISPKARRLAREHNIDPVTMRGSGPDGEVLAEDVLTVVSALPIVKPAVETIGTVWRLMAQRTAQSWATVPHFFVSRDVDAGALVEARARVRDQSITYTDFLIALVARVLSRHPRVNGSWSEEGIRLNEEINVGLATAIDDGVVVTVVRHANRSSLDTIAASRREMTERARAGRTRPPDLAGATFTISNLGTHRVDAFSAIINPPQAAILAVGSLADRVVAVGGQPAVRPMMTLTLSCDHRVIDGARAAAFLNDVADAIGDPDKSLE